MLRTKLTDTQSEAQHENLDKVRNEVGLETLEDDMPDLESAQVFSRDSSSEVTVNSVPHILGSVQVHLDDMFTSIDSAYYCSLRTDRSWLHGRSFLVNYKKWLYSTRTVHSRYLCNHS